MNSAVCLLLAQVLFWGSVWVIPCIGASEVGQTDLQLPKNREEVIRVYGEPAGAVTAGNKEILTYPDRKVVLMEGAVMEITTTAPRDGESAPKNLRYLRPPRGSFRLGYDPSTWVQQSSEDPESDRFMRRATHVSGDIEIAFNTENTSYAGHDLAGMILERVKATDPSFVLKKKEIQRIKGGNVVHLRVQERSLGILKDVDFYIHSSAKGTAQLMVAGASDGMIKYAADVAAVPGGLEILSAATPEVPEAKPVTVQIPGSDIDITYDPRDWTPADSATVPSQRTLKLAYGKIYVVMKKYPPELKLDDVQKLLTNRLGEDGKKRTASHHKTTTSRIGTLHCVQFFVEPSSDQKSYILYLSERSNGVDSVAFMGSPSDLSRFSQHIKQIIGSMKFSQEIKLHSTTP